MLLRVQVSLAPLGSEPCMPGRSRARDAPSGQSLKLNSRSKRSDFRYPHPSLSKIFKEASFFSRADPQLQPSMLKLSMHHWNLKYACLDPKFPKPAALGRKHLRPLTDLLV